jgi:heptosyltransferase-1
MSAESTTANPRILVVRLGALGDIIHALPAVATLKRRFPQSRITWMVEPRWTPILDGNPHVDRIAVLRRNSAASLLESWRDLRAESYDLAIDFQGLLKSALSAAAARPQRIIGFRETRERAATWFYNERVAASSAHVVDRNLELAAATGATPATSEFPLPPGNPESDLPAGDFVLASPLAGWLSKQWPAEFYAELAARLDMPLVVNVPAAEKVSIPGALEHVSTLPGLIHATRRAAAVIGVDSGPMHLADALGKPGVALFGPTDPRRNGPYNRSLRVLRSPSAVTTYKRKSSIDDSMRLISPAEVLEALRASLRCPVR